MAETSDTTQRRRCANLSVNLASRAKFHLVLIKPSHYDDDGYVIQWVRSAIPSNTLACLNGLVLDCNERRVLGEDVEIVVEAFDETNTRLPMKRVSPSESRYFR